MRHLNNLFTLLLFVLLTSANGLLAQSINMQVEVTGVSSNYSGGDPNGPDPTWIATGKITFGDAGERVLTKYQKHVSNGTSGSISNEDDFTMYDNTFTLPSGYRLCDNPVVLFIETDAWENDCGSDFEFGTCFLNSDDDRRGSTHTRQIGSYAPNEWHDQSIGHSSGLYTFNIRFRYTLQNSIASLDFVDESGEPVAGRICESAFSQNPVTLKAKNAANAVGGIYRFERSVKGANVWTYFRQNFSGEVPLTTSDLKTYDFRVRHQYGGSGNCMGNTDGWRTKNNNIEIVESFTNGLRVSTENACPGILEGSITYPGFNGLPAGVMVALSLSKTGTTGAFDSQTVPVTSEHTFTGLAPGSYKMTLEVTYPATGDFELLPCSSIIDGIIVGSKPVPITAIESTSPACGQTTGSVRVRLIGGSTSQTFTYDLLRKPTDEVVATSIPIFGSGYQFNGVPPGTYTVRTSTPQGCDILPANIASINVNEPTPAVVDYEIISQAGEFDAACDGDEVPVDFHATPGHGAYRVILNGSSVGDIPADGTITRLLRPGGYGLVFERIESGCRTTQEIISISVNPNQPRLSLGMTENPTACMPMSGTVEVTVSGGEPPFTYTITPGNQTVTKPEASHTFTGLAGGSYQVLLTDANGCQRFQFASLNPSSSLSLSGTVFLASCPGVADARIELRAFGGLGELTYRIDELSMDFVSSPVFSGMPPGSYSATVMDEDNCQTTEVFEVRERLPIVIDSISQEVSRCRGNEVGVQVWVTGRETDDSFNAPSPGEECFDYRGRFEISSDGGATFIPVTSGDDNFCNLDFPTELIIDLFPGDYELQVRDKIHGCVSNVFQLTQDDFVEPEELVAELTDVQDISCRFARDGSITVSVSGAFPGYVIELYDLGQSQLTAIEKVLLTEEGNYTFYDLPPSVNTSTVPGEYNGGYSIRILSGRDEIGGGALQGGDGGVVTAKSLSDNFECFGYIPARWTIEDITPISITEPDFFEIIGLDFDDLLNCDGTGGQVIVTVQGGTPPYEYSLNGREFQTSNVLDDYTFFPEITVRDANGCVYQSFYDDPFPTFTTLDATADQVTPAIACIGGTASVDITPSTGPYTVIISQFAGEGSPPDIIREVITEETSVLFEDLPPGTYDVTVQDSFTCSAFWGFIIEMPEQFQVNTTNKTPASCVDAADGTISLLVTGGAPPYRTVVNGFEVEGQTRTVMNLKADNYTILAFDANDCVTVLEEAILPASDIETIVSTVPTGPCLESSTGTLGITATGGEAPYTIEWLDDPSFNQTLQEGEESVRTGLSSKEWQFILTDANGCSEAFDRFVPGPDSMFIEVTNIRDPNCDVAGSFELVVEGGSGTYLASLNGGTPTSNLQFTGLAEGDYNIMVTDDAGCASQFMPSVTLTQRVEINTTATTENILCAGSANGSITILPPSGVTNVVYQLFDGPIQPTPIFSGLGPGIYSVTVLSPTCSQTITDLVIEENPPLGLESSISATNCATGQALVALQGTGGNGDYAYGIDGLPADTPTTFTGDPGTTYDVEVQDGNGCFDFFQVTIPDFDPLRSGADATTSATCIEGTGTAAIEVSGGTPPYSFQWADGGPADSLFTNVNSGDYTVTVTDANGCELIETATVGFIEPVSLDRVDLSTQGCDETRTGQINVRVNNPTAGYTYALNGGAPQSSQVFSGLMPATYFVDIVSPAGCSLRVDNIMLVLDDELALITDITPAPCGVGVTTLRLIASGGSGSDYAYGLDGNPPDTPDTYDVSPGQTYDIEVQDGNGCFRLFEVTIPDPQPVEIAQVQVQASECAPNAGRLEAIVIGGQAPYTFEWSNGGPTERIFNNAGEGTYTVTVTDADGCTAVSNPETIVETERPDFTAQTQDAGCGLADGSVTLTVVGDPADFDFQWQAGVASTTNVASGLTSGNYAFTITNRDNDCFRTGSAIVNSTDAPTLSLVPGSVTDARCDVAASGAARVVAAAGSGSGYVYEWSSGETGPSAAQLLAGDNLVTVTDGNLCTAVLTVTIAEAPSPDLRLEANTPARCDVAASGIATVSVTGGNGPFSYLWSNGATGVTANNLLAGANTVTVTDANGCTDVLTVNTSTAASPRLALESQTEAGCIASILASATVSVTGGNGPFSYAWSTGATSATATNLPAGDNTVTVTDANGCTDELTVTIVTAESPSLTLENQTEAGCVSTALASATVSASGGNGAYAFDWSSGATTATATNLLAGDNTVTVTDANGCTDVLTVTILTANGPMISLVSQSEAGCEPAASGGATVMGSAGSVPYTFEWSSGETGESASMLVAGDNSVTVTDAKGCTAALTVTIVQAEDPVISLDSQSEIGCAAGSTATATVSATGGNAPYAFDWSTGATGETANDLVAGDNTVTVTDANGCTDEITVTILTTDGPMISLASQSEASCDPAASGGATVMATAGSPPYAFAWSSGETGEMATMLLAGDNTVTVTDANGCTAELTVTITEATGPMISLETQTEAGCDATSLATSTVSASGGRAPYAFDWSSGETSATATMLLAGDNTVTVTDANGCTDELTVTIVQAENPTLELLNQTDAGCSTDPIGSANVAASGGLAPYAFDWSTGETGTRATMLALGDNTVTVTDANGCTDVLTVTILGAESPTISLLSQTIAGCGDQALASATVSGSGGMLPYAFDWSTGATGATASDLVAGDNTVTVTDANGCTDELTVTIEQAPSPSLTLITQTEAGCNGTNPASATVSASGGTPLYAYDWSNGETGPTALNLPPGDATVTVTDAAGCSDVLTLTILEANAPTLSIVSQTLAGCAGPASATVSATGGNPPYAFDWDNGETGPTAVNLPTGTNTATVTDANGCSASINLEIGQADAPVASIDNLLPANCIEGTGAITITVNGGNGELTYVWSHDNTINLPQVTNLFSGTYSVTVTDELGCSDVLDDMVVGFNPQPDISLVGTTPASCGEANGSIEISVDSDAGGLTYAWTDDVSTGPLATGLAGGTYSVTVTDANGCQDVRSELVEAVSTPFVNTSSFSDALCGEMNGFIVVSVEGGQMPFVYDWSHDATLEGNTASNLAGGEYIVTVTDATGCAVTFSHTITGFDAIILESEETTSSTCGENNGTITVNLSGGTGEFTYTWSHDATERGSSLSGLAAGSYSLLVTDNRGCTYEQEYLVGNEDGPTISSTQPLDALCVEGTGSITVNVSGGTLPYVFNWSHDAALTGNTAANLNSGAYTIVVEDANGCETTANLNLDYFPSPDGSLTVTEPTCGSPNSGSIEVTGVDAGVMASWSDGGSGLNRTGLSAGQYEVTLTDVNGCTDELTTTLPERIVPQLVIESQEDVACAEALGTVSFLLTGTATPDELDFSDENSTLETEVLNDGNTRISVAGLAAGQYSLTVTSASGCPTTVMVEIIDEVAFQLAVSASVPVSCNGGTDGSATVSVTGSDDTFTFQWDAAAGDQTGPVATNLAAGTYSLTATSSRGCQAITTATIAQPDALLLTEEENLPVACFGESTGSLTAMASGGTMPYTYRWRGDTLPAVRTQSGNLPAGVYELTVTDDNGCEAVLEMTVAQPSALTATAVVTSSDCAETATGTITVTPTGGTEPYAYLWLDIPGLATNEATELAAGDYTIRITDANGCMVEFTETVTNASGTITITVEEVVGVSCLEALDGSITVSAAGSPADFTYAWSNGDTGPTASSLSGGQDYIVTATNSLGCSQTLTVPLENGPALEVTGVAADTTLCAGNFYVLDLSEYATVIINGPGGFFSNDPVSILEDAGDYEIEVTNAAGCNASFTSRLNLTAQSFTARMVVASDAVISEPLIVLEASFPEPDNVSWVFDQSRVSITGQDDNLYSFTFTEPGVYDLGLVASFGGCEDLVSKQVTIHADSTTIPGVVLGATEILSLDVSPNPNNGVFSINAELSRAQPFTLSIFRGNGERIERRRIDGQTTIGEAFDLDLVPGTYFLQAQAGNERRMVPVVVQ